jgi:hypothetical protein
MGRTLQGLLTRFVLQRGRKPNNLEMILLKREAAQTGIEERKIISMVDRQPVNPNEPIMGGQNLKKEFISETDDEIIARLKKGNEDSLNRLKNKKDKPDDMATGGRAGYYGGGVTSTLVGEDLSDIGHGSDSLMARNMQIAPGGQATTSTGLNYLLGQDNDTARVPYKDGEMVLPQPKPNADPMVELLRVYNIYQESMPGVSQETQKYLKEDFIQKLNDAGISQEAFMTNRMQNNFADGGRIGYNKGKAVKPIIDEGRRGFMKAAGATTAGIAALKTGLLGFGKEAAPVVEKAAEAVSNTASQVPAYFLNLVSKIKMMGDDVTQKAATQDRQVVKQYKDFEMTEDVTTGEIQIFKKSQSDEAIDRFGGENATEEVFMRYKPSETIIGKNNKPVKTGPEYEENTSYISNNRENTGGILDDVDGVPDDVIEEANYTFDKADGGRIGYNKGKAVKELIKAGEGKFTKAQYLIERIKNTIKGSPDDKYVQETFPGFIKELEANPDLAKNENVFKELGGDLPEGQQIVVYGDDTLDFFTTSSGPQNIKKLEEFMAKHGLPRDKALKFMKMEPNDQVMELTKTKFLKNKQTDN